MLKCSNQHGRLALGDYTWVCAEMPGMNMKSYDPLPIDLWIKALQIIEWRRFLPLPRGECRSRHRLCLAQRGYLIMDHISAWPIRKSLQRLCSHSKCFLSFISLLCHMTLARSIHNHDGQSNLIHRSVS